MRKSRLLAAPCLALLLAAGSGPAHADDPLTTAGDVLKYALPGAAAVCAARQERLASYVTGFAVMTATVEGLKYGLGDASINQRPDGGDGGFPSGHTAAAASGATDLSLNCAPGNRGSRRRPARPRSWSGPRGSRRTSMTSCRCSPARRSGSFPPESRCKGRRPASG